MADTKISALTAATTPLAGTEVLPIVQSGVTKQVSVANLTAGRAVNVASLTASGNVQADTINFGSSYGQFTWDTGVAILQTYSGKDFVVRTQGSSTNRFTVGASNVTVNTGNLVIGTSGKGIDFSATGQAAGMTSELLSDYEEGTWTPAITLGGATTGITYSTQVGKYVKTGSQVTATLVIGLSSKGSATGTMRITGLPYSTGTNGNVSSTCYLDNCTLAAGASPQMLVNASSTTIIPAQQVTGNSFTLADTNLTNGSYLVCTFTYYI